MVRQTPCLPYLGVHTVSTKASGLGRRSHRIRGLLTLDRQAASNLLLPPIPYLVGAEQGQTDARSGAVLAELVPTYRYGWGRPA